jgi:hypothetical protein
MRATLWNRVGRAACVATKAHPDAQVEPFRKVRASWRDSVASLTRLSVDETRYLSKFVKHFSTSSLFRFT